jgi:hypothetical protein
METTFAILAMARISSRSAVFPFSARNASRSFATSKWSTMVSLPLAFTMMTSRTPAATASATMYWMVGVSTIGSSSLATALVAGKKRVPRPAAGMTALRMGWFGMARQNLAAPVPRREGRSPQGSSRPAGALARR